MSNGGKLHANLVLQSCGQRDKRQRCSAERLPHGIPQLGAIGLRITLLAQILKHSLFSKVVNERALRGVEASANHRKILANRSVPQELANERLTVWLSPGKEQNPGSEAIDAMDDECALPFRAELIGKKRQSGDRI